MEMRQIAGLVIALLTLACVAAAILYATRDERRHRRNVRLGERDRRLQHEERMLAEKEGQA